MLFRSDPAAAGLLRRLDPLDRGAGADVGVEAEVSGVATEILEALPVVRVGRPLPRHRVIGKLGELFRADEPGGGEDGRGRGAEIPVAADVVLPLEALGGDASALKALDVSNISDDKASYPQ